MKTGRSLQEIAAELERQRETRKDYLAPQAAIQAKVVDGHVVLDGFNGDPLGIRPYAHKQLADHLGIPQRYYDRMQAEQPQLLAANMNTWLGADGQNRRMVRTLDGQVRAVLSPKFRPLDNFDLAQSILPTLLENKVQILSSELTETRFYLKGILPDLSDELPAGMVWGNGHNAVAEYQGNQPGRIVAAIVISNSDVGAGTLRVEPSVFTTWCTNLAVMAQAAMRKYHVGRAFEADTNWEVFRDETRRLDDVAFWAKVQDVTRAAFDPQVWAAAVAQIRDATTKKIVSDDLPKVVDVTVKQLALPVSSSSGILKHLAGGGDLSKWGLASAITATANGWGDYEVATDLERAGGHVLALDGPAWDKIAQAAA